MNDLTRLQSLEAEAHAHLQHAQSAALTAVTHWNAFVQCLSDIQNTGIFALKYTSWDEYTRNEFGVSSSRVRQIRIAADTAAMLIELTGIAPQNEKQVRAFNQVTAGLDDTTKAEVWARAALATDGQPEPRHLRATVDVLTEREVTQGYVTIEGESRLADVLNDSTQLAVLEAVREADERRRQHIRDNSSSISFECEIGAIQRDDMLFAVLVGDIPASVIGKHAKVYVRV